MRKDKTLFYVNDVMALLKISKDSAYKVIRELNNELKEKGYMVRRGAVSKAYFVERYGL